uniref:Uncharacterized protein n=1 Tax=Aegilops tauschii subsp. strangulata TaxID=200361 RepID=A0A453EDR2_AEGTS
MDHTCIGGFVQSKFAAENSIYFVIFTASCLLPISPCTSTLFFQVHEFLSTLVDARDELLQKSENTRRSITIRKAMLSNSRNGRSSHDHLRLCQQVDKLEFEYERLKKDASIYHNLHEQLQLSSCYKLMEESNDEAEKRIREGAFAKGVRDTAFEELLAVEKKDNAFWRRDGKLRSISDSM